MNVKVDNASKRVYVSPKLVVYGDVRDLTRTVGNGAINDGDGNGAVKTG